MTKPFTAELTEWLTDLREGTRTQPNFADWLEEHGDERCVIMREADGARWQVIWLFMLSVKDEVFLGADGRVMRGTWQDAINADDFESLPSAKAEKLLWAEWLGEQEVECEGCRGGGVRFDTRSNKIPANTHCWECHSTGKIKDSRRRAGMRLLVVTGHIARGFEGEYRIMTHDGLILKRATRYEAYADAASAVGRGCGPP